MVRPEIKTKQKTDMFTTTCSLDPLIKTSNLLCAFSRILRISGLDKDQSAQDVTKYADGVQNDSKRTYMPEKLPAQCPLPMHDVTLMCHP